MGFQGASAAPQPHVYLSTRQAESWQFIYLRPRENMAIAQSAVESATRQVDPDLITGAVIPLSSNAAESFMISKMFGLAIGAMSLCGTLLAMLGVYGVIAYGVSRRTREIGLRIALGARPEQVVSLFTRQAMRFTAIGLGLGVVMAAALSLVTRIFVFGTSLLDPVPYVVAGIAFAGVSLLASWLAARRASRVEPLDALRSL
jgi:ABC-type antimicrobial peptide transport system permease subunit